MFKRAIVHMDLDAFFVSVERIKDPSLEQVPVIIGGASDRGVVASCSYEVRKYGVHSAMPMVQARRLCPKAKVIKGSREDYTYFSQKVTDIIQQEAPDFEKSSIDEFYLDLSGMERFFGCWERAKHIRQRIIRETGLPISFGLSQNKIVSKIATGEAKPNNQIQVKPGEEASFLAPLSIKKIPMVGAKTYERLGQLGIKTIKDVQQKTPEQLEQLMGQMGSELHNKALGIDYGPVVNFRQRKSVSKERTFSEDTKDIIYLKSILTKLLEQVAFTLREKNLLSSCVAIKIRYKSFKTYTFQHKIPYSAADHILLPYVLQLFEQSYNQHELIRLIGVRCSDLINSGAQMQLFDDKEHFDQLYDAIDNIKNKFGENSIARAKGLDREK